MASYDPFVIAPTLWFGLLCHGIGSDPVGRLNFQGVFNQVAFYDPPVDTGVAPHAPFNGILAVGFSGGIGHFQADIQLRDSDNKRLWSRPEGRWVFDIGPGLPSAVLAEQVTYWLKQPGAYHFWIHLPEVAQEYVIPVEVARVIGPASVTGRVSPPQ